MSLSYPQARTGLVTQRMDSEWVVYDQSTAQANLLNSTAAVIFSLCDGKTGVSEIAARASRELSTPIDEAVVWYTLAQLSKKNLLHERALLPANFKNMTRRDFLRAGLVGAAVVVPVIVTVTAPPVAYAASCVASGQQCQFSNVCCSGLCNGGSCA